MNKLAPSDDDLEMHLNTLIHEYGLISVLEGLHAAVKDKTESLNFDSDEHKKLLCKVSQSIADLIETLPEEIDIEIA
jgi:hypothetical protein